MHIYIFIYFIIGIFKSYEAVLYRDADPNFNERVVNDMINRHPEDEERIKRITPEELERRTRWAVYAIFTVGWLPITACIFLLKLKRGWK